VDNREINRYDMDSNFHGSAQLFYFLIAVSSWHRVQPTITNNESTGFAKGDVFTKFVF
jgi:hypothetical protein